jgi:ParB/RepB/Spo0J family partition protein
MDYPKMIQLSQLHAHPKNPRICIREDVVEGIVESLRTEGFKPEYVLIVRPFDGEYQILSGHHRYVAAQRAELDGVPCWVRDMDDDAVYMALVTSNTQGELTPLEIGLHALECVEKAQGKRGGGLEEYARALGKSRPAISQFRAAAEVYSELRKLTNEVALLANKATHLFELHSAPRETWPLLAEAMLNGDWNVKNSTKATR